MEIKTGTTRRVFVFKNVVIKIARIKIFKVFHGALLAGKLKWGIIRKGEWRKYRGRVRQTKANRPAQKVRFENLRLEKEKELGLIIPLAKNYEKYGSDAMFLLAGIMANRQEWQFSRQSRNPFIMPTYFSFFGLFNVQKAGLPISFWDNLDVWCYVCTNSQNEKQPWCDNHSLYELENYCLDGRQLKMVDYGSRFLAPFLEINGERLSQNFKLPC